MIKNPKSLDEAIINLTIMAAKQSQEVISLYTSPKSTKKSKASFRRSLNILLNLHQQLGQFEGLKDALSITKDSIAETVVTKKLGEAFPDDEGNSFVSKD